MYEQPTGGGMANSLLGGGKATALDYPGEHLKGLEAVYLIVPYIGIVN